MTLLRRTLKVQAALWLLWSLALGLAPRLVLEDLFSQPILAEYAWVRASAVMGAVLALLMVLVAQRIEELWWWSWAFAVLEVGTATVFAINAAVRGARRGGGLAVVGAGDDQRRVRRVAPGRHGLRGPGEAVRMSGAVADPLGPIDEFAEQVMVPMADGIRLATDVYLPRGGRGADRLPCILVRLPYDKSAPFAFMPRLAAWFTERGYAFVAQDVRGRARSEGETFAFVHEVSDGSATLDWIVAQPWSNGVVGMFGDSYYGWTQWAAVASGHEALRAIVPRVTSVEIGTDWRETGGVFNAYQMIEWAAGTWSGTENFECDLDWTVRPLADVQADAHGGRRSRSLDRWISAAGDDAWWWEALYAGRGDPRARLRVPALHTGGWWDVFRRGQIRDFRAVHGRVPGQHLVMEATDHFDDWLRDRDAPPFVDFIDDAAEMERWLPAYAEPADGVLRSLPARDGRRSPDPGGPMVLFARRLARGGDVAAARGARHAVGVDGGGVGRR